MVQPHVGGRPHLKRRRDLRRAPTMESAKPISQPIGMRPDEVPPPPGYDLEQRSFFDRIGDEVRSWFGDEEAEHRREYDELMHQGYSETHRVGFAPPGKTAPGYKPFTYPQSGFASSRPPPTYIDHDREYDMDYQIWRERQIAALDRDYQEYRQESQRQFENDFNGWRERRCAQRDCLDQVTEKMEVIGSDGQSVGTVSCVRGDRIILSMDELGVCHSIPSRWLSRVEDKVVLEKTANETRQRWRDDEPC